MTTTKATAGQTMTTTAEQTDDSRPAAAVTGRRLRLVFVTVLVASLLSALDQTIVSTALPTIVGDLGGGDHLSWVVSAYLLADTVSTVLAGKLGDLFGRKRVLLVSAGLFVIASATCGFADGMTWLIAWRGVQGLGAGGLAVSASAVIADVVPVRDRAKYQSGLGAVFGVALVLGPLLGGLFTDHLSWRWVFFINIPLGALVMLAAARMIPRSPAPQQRPAVDYAGIGFVSAGCRRADARAQLGRRDLRVDFAHRRRAVPVRRGDVRCLRRGGSARDRADAAVAPVPQSHVFSVSVALAFIVGFAMLGALTFLPTYSQYVKGVSPTASGVRTLPMVVGLFAASMFVGVVVGHTGATRSSRSAGSW